MTATSHTGPVLARRNIIAHACAGAEPDHSRFEIMEGDGTVLCSAGYMSFSTAMGNVAASRSTPDGC